MSPFLTVSAIFGTCLFWFLVVRYILLFCTFVIVSRAIEWPFIMYVLRLVFDVVLSLMDMTWFLLIRELWKRPVSLMDAARVWREFLDLYQPIPIFVIGAGPLPHVIQQPRRRRHRNFIFFA